MDNFLIWLLVLGVLALAFGPILLFLPSSKDKRLAALRAEARRQGLRVQLQPVPKLAAEADERVTAGGRRRMPMHPSVCYWLALPPAAAALRPWRLLRGPNGWVADADLPPPPELAARLLPLLDPLPEDAVAVEHRSRSLGCCWLERFPAGAETVAGLKAALADIAKALPPFYCASSAACSSSASAASSAPGASASSSVLKNGPKKVLPSKEPPSSA